MIALAYIFPNDCVDYIKGRAHFTELHTPGKYPGYRASSFARFTHSSRTWPEENVLRVYQLGFPVSADEATESREQVR